MKYQGIISRYRQYLPIAEQHIVTLHEGSTPLLPALQLAEKICPGLKLFLKLEGLNPTGSFKDRGMTYAVSKAGAGGSHAIICASTGNTSAAAAAYGARASMKVVVIIPAGKIAYGKLAQALIHGAQVIQIKGSFDQALEVVKEVTARKPCTVVNSINPDRLLGQKTAAYEICDELGFAPDYHVLPVGNAGNITAYWQGYQDYHLAGTIKTLPKMLGFQAAGAAPIVKNRIIKAPETVASAIRIGNPANWETALKARDESGGLINSVTDREILTAYRLLAAVSGYFAEPASAASVAGVIKLAKRGFFKAGDTVVCTLTGHGLKDPDTAIGEIGRPVSVPATIKAVLKVLKL